MIFPKGLGTFDSDRRVEFGKGVLYHQLLRTAKVEFCLLKLFKNNVTIHQPNKMIGLCKVMGAATFRRQFCF